LQLLLLKVLRPLVRHPIKILAGLLILLHGWAGVATTKLRK
jgi:hypothetical protein